MQAVTLTSLVYVEYLCREMTGSSCVAMVCRQNSSTSSEVASSFDFDCLGQVIGLGRYRLGPLYHNL